MSIWHIMETHSVFFGRPNISRILVAKGESRPYTRHIRYVVSFRLYNTKLRRVFVDTSQGRFVPSVVILLCDSGETVLVWLRCPFMICSLHELKSP